MGHRNRTESYVWRDSNYVCICKHLNTAESTINSNSIVEIHFTETITWRTVWRQKRRTPLTLRFLRFSSPHVNAKTEFSKISTLAGVFRNLHFQWPKTPFTCGRKVQTHRKICVFKNTRVRVDVAIDYIDIKDIVTSYISYKNISIFLKNSIYHPALPASLC